MKIIGEFIYSDFHLHLMSYDVGDVRYWTPKKGDYEKNLFTSYIFRGAMYEYRSEDNTLDRIYRGELFVDFDITLDYSTYEHFDKDTTWLCFSTWKPIKSDFFRLLEPTIIPAGTGVFCVLGNFKINDNNSVLTARSLNYIKPRKHDISIDGDAKVLLFTEKNEFVNKPINSYP